MSVPNQMIIQEFNYAPCDKNNFYATINLEALQHAMTDLTTLNSLKLWLYLSKNSKTFTHLELSSADCIKNWGMGRSQWKESKEALVAKGYLVPNAQAPGWYDFIQNPETGQEALSKNPETGFYVSFPETGFDYV